MVEIIEVDASHEEALSAKDEQEEVLEPIEAEEQAEKPEEKSKDLQSALAQKEHYRTKLEKSESDRKALEEKLKGFNSQNTGDPMESVVLGKALADISLEEADVIITYAKGKFNNLKPTSEQIIQASKDPVMVAAIKAQREKVRSENKTPAPSSPSSIIGGKTAEDLEKMDTKSFAKMAREQMNGGRSGI